MQNYPNNKDYKLLSQMDLTTINDYIEKIENDKIRNDVHYFIELTGGEIKNLIPFPLSVKIKRTILDWGDKNERLQISDITEKCGVPEDRIELLATEIFNEKIINEEYYKSTQSFVFDQSDKV